ncbi:hypothetical protein [Ectopseudomonas khazarica]|jgi:hypothetical protein|uniref:hypothetical protein n=1 Tax=Ectopseudomonas khazarica TaxID=2502979 RepID=UPI0005F2F7BE|nr:hypothetical protein N619_13765 [Pseudomonas oleovorans]KJU79185.1 hypothetical protein N619_13790 [Pseudomonas oleovorans]
MSHLTFQDLLDMKAAQQGRKLEILRSLSREDIIRLNNEGVAHLERIESRMGKARQQAVT